MPWWGWLITVVVSLIVVYYVVVLAVGAYVGRKVVKSFNKHAEDFKTAHFTADPREDSFARMENRVRRMTGPGRDPFSGNDFFERHRPR